MTDGVDNTNIEAEARELDWVPEEDFQGDKSEWMDARAYLDYQRKLVPIVKKTNARLSEDLNNVKQQVRQLAAQLEASQGDFETLQEFHNEEVSRRVEETRSQLLAGIKVAKREGDVDTEVDLQGQLSKLDAANTRAGDEIEGGDGKNGKVSKTTEAELDPIYLDWQSKNPWFTTDPDRSDEAMLVARKIKREQPDLLGRAFYIEVDKRLSARTTRPGKGKVESSRGGSSRSNEGGRTYADLPAEARAQCDKYAKKFVRKDGRFKTTDEYRRHFINELENTGYFS